MCVCLVSSVASLGDHAVEIGCCWRLRSAYPINEFKKDNPHCVFWHHSGQFQRTHRYFNLEQELMSQMCGCVKNGNPSSWCPVKRNIYIYIVSYMIKKTGDIMYLQMECIDRVACFQVSAWSAQHPSHQAQSQPPPYHIWLALRDVQELVIRNGLNLAASKLQREVMLRHLVTVADESIKGLKSKEGKF